MFESCLKECLEICLTVFSGLCQKEIEKHLKIQKWHGVRSAQLYRIGCLRLGCTFQKEQSLFKSVDWMGHN